MAHGKASELAIMPKLRLMYVPREVAPRTLTVEQRFAMRPRSAEPHGSKLSACVVSAHHPAMKYGCTSTPFVLASKKSCEMPPSKRLVLNNESGWGSNPDYPRRRAAKPYTNRFNPTILPASGPRRQRRTNQRASQCALDLRQRAERPELRVRNQEWNANFNLAHKRGDLMTDLVSHARRHDTNRNRKRGFDVRDGVKIFQTRR